MSPSITPVRVYFPPWLPFLSSLPCHCRHEGSNAWLWFAPCRSREIARLPTVRQGIFWEMIIIFQGKERRKDKGHAWTHCWVTAAPPCPNWEDSHAVNEWLIKITPLYIMSKKGGNCSVNLKKNIKNFFKPLQCRVCPFGYHLYHHAQTVDLQGFTAILRCYGNRFPCFTLDKPLRHKGLRCFSVKSWDFRRGV